MNTPSSNQIIEDFLSVRNFNKTMFLRGAVDEKRYDDAQNKTLIHYSKELCDGSILDLENAQLTLLKAEADEQALMNEYMYMGRTV